MDFGGDLAAAALGDFSREYPAEPVAEIALVDGAAGNWCDIFSAVAACTVPIPKRRIAGAASAVMRAWRRVSIEVP